jgi:hypothetical protein
MIEQYMQMKWHERKQNSNRLYGFSKLAIRPQPGKASRTTRKPKGINEGADVKYIYPLAVALRAPALFSIN